LAKGSRRSCGRSALKNLWKSTPRTRSSLPKREMAV
jgi:hypothetical protein